MQAYPTTTGNLIDGTNMFGAVLIEERNPLNVAIWLDQGYVANPSGSYLEFAGWLFDREIAPIPFIDESPSTVLTPAPCVPGLVQWYWEDAGAATMAAAPAKPRPKPHVPPLQRFLEDLRQAKRNWKRGNAVTIAPPTGY